MLFPKKVKHRKHFTKRKNRVKEANQMETRGIAVSFGSFGLKAMMYGRITSMSRRVINVFEDTVTVDSPAEFLAEQTKKSSIYQKSVPLTPGMYRLNVVVRDVVGGNMNTYELALNVPHYDAEKLGLSTLVLADVIEKVPTKSIGVGLFVLGSTKVRPRISNTFKRDEKKGIYMKAYNFGPDEEQTPRGTVN